MPVSEVHNIDCLEFMKQYPDKYFELAIVDPPYGISVNMNAGRKKDTRSKKRAIKKWDNSTPDELYFNELFRVSKNQIIWGANHMIDKIKVNSQGWIFWDKCVAAGCSFSDGELAWTSFNQALKKAVIPYSGFIGMEDEKFHPTTKPIRLYKWLLSNYAKEGDKILDTHLGSGSSRIAAYIMGFDFYACEIDKDYYEAQEKRFKEQTAQQSLFGFDNLNKAV
jgi:site-specific DNA-methyltransferase (adenine-specific)